MAKKQNQWGMFHPISSHWNRAPQRWRNLVKIAASIGVIAGAITAFAKAVPVVEPYAPAHREFVRGSTAEQTAPLRLVQDRHSIELDYLILKDQRQSLKDAKDDLTKNPNSTEAQKSIERIERSIKRRQDRLDKATDK